VEEECRGKAFGKAFSVLFFSIMADRFHSKFVRFIFGRREMKRSKPIVAVIMGSDSDLPVVLPAVKFLKKMGLLPIVRVLSAHRTPAEAEEFARNAEKAGIDVIIAAAGKAAHLPGVIAASTVLPVIGLPIKSSMLDGLDSLLSIVQMPKGIPVATVAVDGADNAAILAIQILALGYPEYRNKLHKFKKEIRDEVIKKDKLLQEELKKL
jgi:5-(carboxyamino)imidazole ribonucleotide mutase